VPDRDGETHGFLAMDRYSRQTILWCIGSDGQDKIEKARVAVVGLGALGSTAAECLARAGAGELILLDRDILDLSNLQRQILYDEKDVRERLPKAAAAARRLSGINSEISLIERVDNLHAGNIAHLLEGVQIIVDGTDNIETRYLINDYAVNRGIPWVYGGAIGTGGTGLFVLPGEGPCLRCVFPDPPDPHRLGTCDTVGVLGPVPVMVGAWEAGMALRYLAGGGRGLGGRLLLVDFWEQEQGFHEPSVEKRDDCPVCGKREFTYLERRRGTIASSSCGEGMYQIVPAEPRQLKLDELAGRLEASGEVFLTPYYLCFSEGSIRLHVFSNGRAQLQGAGSEEEALSFYSRYVGL